MYSDLQITHISLYKNDIVVHRKMRKRRPQERRQNYYHTPEGDIFLAYNEKGQVTEFSEDSRRNLAFVANNTETSFKVMVTLTYPKQWPMDGKESKKHLDRFIVWATRNISKKYLWFMEFQKRGAPHYHVLFADDAKFVHHEIIALQWYRIVGSNDPKHIAAGTRVEYVRKPEGLNRYIIKYAMKMEQKEVPEEYRNCGRFWGCARSIKPTEQGQIKVDSEEGLKSIIRDWQYLRDDEMVYRVMYNASDVVRNKLKQLNIEYLIGGVGE